MTTSLVIWRYDVKVTINGDIIWSIYLDIPCVRLFFPDTIGLLSFYALFYLW